MTYLVQIADEIRQATEAEAAIIENIQTSVAKLEAQQTSQALARQSARAKLAALGLTDDEINALIP